MHAHARSASYTPTPHHTPLWRQAGQQDNSQQQGFVAHLCRMGRQLFMGLPRQRHFRRSVALRAARSDSFACMRKYLIAGAALQGWCNFTASKRLSLQHIRPCAPATCAQSSAARRQVQSHERFEQTLDTHTMPTLAFCARLLTCLSCNAKVQQAPGLSVDEPEHIGRLQVAVNHVGVVQQVHPVCEVADHQEDGQVRPLLLQPLHTQATVSGLMMVTTLTGCNRRRIAALLQTVQSWPDEIVQKQHSWTPKSVGTAFSKSAPLA